METTKLTKAQQICADMQDKVDEHKAEFIRKMQEDNLDDLGFEDENDDILLPKKRKFFHRKKANEKIQL